MTDDVETLARRALIELYGQTLQQSQCQAADPQEIATRLRMQREYGKLFEPGGLVSHAVKEGKLEHRIAVLSMQIWALGTALLLEVLASEGSERKDDPGIEVGQRALAELIGQARRSVEQPPGMRHDRPQFTPGRKFAIQHPGDYDFAVGHVGKGRPVFFGFASPQVVCLFFDQEGAYQRHELRPLPQLSYEVAYGMRAAWMRELGFTPGTIFIDGFYIPELEAGIYELPIHMKEFQEDLEVRAEYQELDDDPEGPTMEESIEEWSAEGKYVLYWGKEYWMTADGEIEST